MLLRTLHGLEMLLERTVVHLVLSGQLTDPLALDVVCASHVVGHEGGGALPGGRLRSRYTHTRTHGRTDGSLLYRVGYT